MPLLRRAPLSELLGKHLTLPCIICQSSSLNIYTLLKCIALALANGSHLLSLSTTVNDGKVMHKSTTLIIILLEVFPVVKPPKPFTQVPTATLFSMVSCTNRGWSSEKQHLSRSMSALISKWNTSVIVAAILYFQCKIQLFQCLHVCKTPPKVSSCSLCKYVSLFFWQKSTQQYKLNEHTTAQRFWLNSGHFHRNQLCTSTWTEMIFSPCFMCGNQLVIM